MTQRKIALALVLTLTLLAGCSSSVSNSGDDGEQANTVAITKLERGALHYWRVRALSENASGPWSENFFSGLSTMRQIRIRIRPAT